ncbi:DUF3857 domain-containing protein [Flavobacterium pectinovorum]|uniref:DUF3857 domain-containing protein n=1 Tax=Flavobacterium pectinovorum TaxID=29533 RepID=UPI001FAD34F9|nr:DUF3857 domain-containing protein [Flavobacterium pectinovorum]MCI9846113.1 DUF3857 domain-containing protein [Flavobacterium pectinovorum]
MKKIALIFILLFAFQSYSQEIKSYTWDEKPNFIEIPAEYKDQPAVVLFDKRWIHTRVGAYAYATFGMNHFAIKINKAEEINKYNKIKAQDNGYIRDVRDFHARIIKPNGEIKILPQDKIIETEIDKVKSIVFEGVEAGDILEYYFIIKENPSAYGVEVFQKDIPVLLAEFTHTQDGVKFEIFASSEFNKSTLNSKSISTATNIPPFKEESNACNIKNLVKLIYMVSAPPLDIYKWNYFMPQYLSKPSFQYFKKTQAREFIEKLNIGTESTEEKLVKIDEYIKTNFDFISRGETAKKITNLNNGKQKLTAGDIFDLYGFTLKELKIPYKVVAGMSRFSGEVHTEKFVVPLSHEFMYYIPETKKFLSPYEKYLCYGYPVYEVQGSVGRTYYPALKENYQLTFPIAPADFTVNESQSTVSFSDDLTMATIEKTHSYTGYDGQLNRNWVKYIKENEDEKKLEEYIKKRIFGDDFDIKITNYSFENQEFKYNYTNTPYSVKVNAEARESLTENAGNLVLVNLGKMIGKQANLYQETDRKWDVDLNYAKTFKHKIIFNIPNGYEVESFKDLEIDKKTGGDETKNCSFKSTVKVEGNQLIVEVFEIFNSINYPKEIYQEYRNVINASSDFTKASVVLKPKK